MERSGKLEPLNEEESHDRLKIPTTMEILVPRGKWPGNWVANWVSETAVTDYVSVPETPAITSWNPWAIKPPARQAFLRLVFYRRNTAEPRLPMSFRFVNK